MISGAVLEGSSGLLPPAACGNNCYILWSIRGCLLEALGSAILGPRATNRFFFCHQGPSEETPKRSPFVEKST